jgi:hypothetical protein
MDSGGGGAHANVDGAAAGFRVAASAAVGVAAGITADSSREDTSAGWRTGAFALAAVVALATTNGYRDNVGGGKLDIGGNVERAPRVVCGLPAKNGSLTSSDTLTCS